MHSARGHSVHALSQVFGASAEAEAQKAALAINRTAIRFIAASLPARLRFANPPLTRRVFAFRPARMAANRPVRPLPKEKMMARKIGRTRTSGEDFGARRGYRGNVSTLTGVKTAIADNTATSIIRVTVPNANQNASISIDLLAWLGAGTDASESTRVASGRIAIARQTGVTAVAVAATIGEAAIATAAGGGTLTLAYSVASVSGAVGVEQTFDIQVTLVKTGTITDLACMFDAKLMNGQDNGISMAAV